MNSGTSCFDQQDLFDVSWTVYHLKSCLMQASPIAALPAELLIEIFAFCATTDALAALALTRVSHLWRDIAFSSPRVWQVIRLDDRRLPLASLRAQARLWTRLSAPLPFVVDLHVESPDLILPLLSTFTSVLHRWQGLTISGNREESITFSEAFPSFQSLDCLFISIREELEEPDLIDDDHIDTQRTFEPSSPFLPDHIAMHIRLTELPSSLSLTPLQFTTVKITLDSIGIPLQPASLLDFLSACSEIEEFTLTGWIHDVEQPSLCNRVVKLPHLHTLELQSTCTARAILSSIDCPNLEELILSHLNVDFRLPGDFDEDGDSEDEAHDFSQSPWSDHATGMGLRRLISRCSPPIRVLEMNFSDMRTKDFKYLFDRLPYLEDFSIVASDMSNTVINLLRPFGTALAEGVQEAQSMHVRLPMLQSLELRNCHRLSGQVVVDVLTSRVKYTDRFTPKSTLSEVAIIGCDSVTAQHAFSLGMELRHRLRYLSDI